LHTHQWAKSSRLLRDLFALQMAVPVEKNVDYLPHSPKQIPISSLVSSGFLLIDHLTPYLST
jgi:hypothetical protein